MRSGIFLSEQAIQVQYSGFQLPFDLFSYFYLPFSFFCLKFLSITVFIVHLINLHSHQFEGEVAAVNLSLHFISLGWSDFKPSHYLTEQLRYFWNYLKSYQLMGVFSLNFHFRTELTFSIRFNQHWVSVAGQKQGW